MVVSVFSFSIQSFCLLTEPGWRSFRRYLFGCHTCCQDTKKNKDLALMELGVNGEEGAVQISTSELKISNVTSPVKEKNLIPQAKWTRWRKVSLRKLRAGWQTLKRLGWEALWQQGQNSVGQRPQRQRSRAVQKTNRYNCLWFYSYKSPPPKF